MDTSFRLFPDQASTLAPRVDAVYFYLLGVSAFFTILIAGLIVFFAIRYRRGSSADRTPPSHKAQAIAEAVWIIIPFLFTVVMFVWGASIYFSQMRPPAGALVVNAIGKQWMWKFQHSNGRREINDLHVPRGRPVRVSLISQDVIHSLYIPVFRVKHDVLPERYTGIWFDATRTGEFHLFCAEYCGAKHSEMRGRVIVMEPSEYEAWLAGDVQAVSPAEAGKQLFEQMRCADCHRGGGVDSRGPPLENLYGSVVPLQTGRTVIADETYLRESIVRPAAKLVAGYPPIMPPFEAQISEEGLAHLIAYIKSLASDERVPNQP